ncbi:MAG: hypothetical protein JW959_01030 [Pirellulales bacterium]|nr:hypothetical protein [Pirellulales bacterium]
MRVRRISVELFRAGLIVLCVFSCAAAWAAGANADVPRITAEVFDSGFQHAHDTYNGMGLGSDGKIYYALSATKYDVAGRLFSFDPATRKITCVGDLTEQCGEKGENCIAQGKAHNNFIEYKGKLYYSTHLGYYVIIDDMEKPGPPPPGWKPYQGGHLLSYDLETGEAEDLGIPRFGNGIIAMNMDNRRGRIYALTWPTGNFVTYDVKTKEMKDLGSNCLDGEGGKGRRYRTICRALAVDPTDGSVYFTNGDGDILRYDYNTEKIETIEEDNMRKDYFGLYDPSSAGHMGYNWRQVVRRPADKCFYGVHGNSGYLFRFDPRERRVTVLDRLTSLPSKRCGMFDQFSYGYLGFMLGADGRTLYYLTGAPIYVDGKRLAGKDTTGKGEAKGLENLHLITYDIPTEKYIDHGAIFLPDGQRPLYVNSIALDNDGNVYTLCRIKRGDRVITDLIRVPAESIKLEQ